MTNEPIELLVQAQRHADSQSQYLTQRIAQIQLQNTPKANRRKLTPEGFWENRSVASRRARPRAAVERRENSDRRLPYEERMGEYQCQLAQILERSIELSNLKRLLQG
jgi:hypothetical protein